MLSVKGNTRIINFKKTETTRHYSQHHIPSRCISSNNKRVSHLKIVRIENFPYEKNTSQTENYRLYFCINQQKSSYQDLFSDKRLKNSKAKDSARYNKVLSELPHKQQVIHFKQQMGKITKLKQLLSGKQNICQRKKKQYPRCFRGSDQSFTSNIAVNFKVEEKQNIDVEQL